MRRGLLAGLLLAALLSGCGAADRPVEAVPALAGRLEQVDAAVVAGDDARTREAVTALVDDTEAALASGDLSREQADAITTAAEALLARLEEPSGSQGSEQEPTPAPTETETEEPESESEPEPEPAPEPEPKGPKPDKPDKPDKPEKDDEGDD